MSIELSVYDEEGGQAGWVEEGRIKLMNAAPEIKVDMEPVAYAVISPHGVVYCETVPAYVPETAIIKLYSAEQVATLLSEQLVTQREKYDKCYAELLAIHQIASCGYVNVYQHPITSEDTMTVRDVKVMALELLNLATLQAENEELLREVEELKEILMGEPDH